jgi:hypothetical protein
MVLRRVSNDAIRATGYRALRVREWIDWGAGECQVESVLIVEVTAVCEARRSPGAATRGSERESVGSEAREITPDATS